MKVRKAKVSLETNQPPIRLIEIAFTILPLLVLIPNFRHIPSLSYNGLATQELVYSWAALTMAVLILIQILRARKGLSLSRQHLPLAATLVAFCLWQATSMIWAPDRFETLRIVTIWLGFTIFTIGGVLSLRIQSALWMTRSMMLLAAILAWSQISEYIQSGGVMSGVFFSHGITAELLAMLIPMLLINYLTTEKKWLAALSFLVASLSGVALLLTLRRGALAGVFVALAGICLALAFKWLQLHSKQRLIILVAALVLAAGPLVYFKREAIRERFQGATQLHATEFGLRSRVTVWATAWEMGKRHLILGVGAGGFSSLSGNYRRYFIENPRFASMAEAAEVDDDEIHNRMAHNEYLQIFAELGLIGTTLFFAFWTQVLQRLWQQRRAPASHLILGAACGLTAFAISSATSAFSFRFTPGALLAACVTSSGLAAGRKSANPTVTQETNATAFTWPKLAGVAVMVVVAAACVTLIARAQHVLESQQLQSPLDFEFSLDSPAYNEGLLLDYQQVLQLDPYNSGAHLGCGLLLYQMGRIAESIPHVEYALKHRYGRPYTYVLLAFDYEQASDLKHATRLLAECVASFPKSVYARAVYAEFLQQQGEIDAAREQHNAMQRMDEKLARSWTLALRLRPQAAADEATRLDLIPPDALNPTLARALVQARADHYLK